MRRDKKACHWSSGLVSVVTAISLTVLTGNGTFAQITPDNTLGTEGSVVTPNIDVKGLPAELIEGGATRGANLFHSFLEFNIGEGQRAYFANPVQIENILSRVTGNNPSNILGMLGVLGNANLFFINPHGIIFGPNAQLDIRGSFVASTANSLVFNNGFEFSATNPAAPPLLTVNIIPGLQYGTNYPEATIANAGKLAVGKDLTLSAANLDLQGQLYAGRDLTLQALDTLRVRDSALAPFIAAAGGQLLVQGNQSVDIFALNHSNSGLFSYGDIVLRSANTVGGDAHYWSGGNFRIEKLDGSLGNLYSPYDPIIRSRGDVTFNDYSGASLHILAGGSVNINTVTITSSETGTVGVDFIQEDFQLSDGTPITINGSERATLDIRAGMNPDEVGSPGTTGLDPSTDFFLDDSFFPEVPTLTNSPTKASADITINSIEVFQENGLVFLTNKYKPNTSLDVGIIKIGAINQDNFFGGGGDSIYIDAIGDISLTRINADGNPGFFNNDAAFGGQIVLLSEANIQINGEISSSSESNSLGKGGDIRITADSIFLAGGLNSGAAINTRTLKKGDAGNVLIKASNTVVFNENSKVTSEVNNVAQGNAGNIEITSRFPTDSLSIEVKEGANLVSRTLGQGNAGTIMIQAPAGKTRISGTTTVVNSNVSAGAIGNGGDIIIQTDSLSLENGAQLRTLVNPPDPNQNRPAGQGNAGNVDIQARLLSLSNGAQILSSTAGKGNAGSVIINATNATGSIKFDSAMTGVFTSVEAGAVGDGGDIKITAPELSLTNGAALFADTSGNGKAGNISVLDANSIFLSGSSISTAVNQGAIGEGGAIDLQTRSLSLDNAQISAATSGMGNAGSIQVQNAESVSLSGSSISTEVNESAVGQGGNIDITTRSLSLNNAQVSAATAGQGDAGSISVQDANDISLFNNSSIFTETNSTGKAGDITLTTGTLTVGTSRISATAKENATSQAQGSVTVNANQISLFGSSTSGIFAQTQGATPAGELTLQTNGNPTLLVNLADGAEISASTSSSGAGGSLKIIAPETVTINGNGQLSTETTGAGVAGNVEITSQTLNVQNGARVSATTASGETSAQGGAIAVKANQINLSGQGSSLLAETQGAANAGALTLQTNNNPTLTINLADGAKISASTNSFSSGQGGNLTVVAPDSVAISGNGQLSAETNGSGKGGKVEITTRTLTVSDGTRVSATAAREATAGDLQINAKSVTLNNQVGLTAASESGQGGNITLQGLNTLAVNNSNISASTIDGQAGSIQVSAADSVQLTGGQLSVEATGNGSAGGISVSTPQLTLNQSSGISASTVSGTGGGIILNGLDTLAVNNSNISASTIDGQAGSIQVSAADSVQLTGGQLSVEATGNGSAGGISVSTPQLTLNQDSEISASTVSGTGGDIILQDLNTLAVDNSNISASTQSGQAGNLTINAQDVQLNNQAKLTTESESGQGGNITLDGLDTLEVNNSEISASTASGRAGNLTANAKDSVRLRGEGGLFVAATEGGTAGDLTVTTGEMTIEDSAEVSVSSPQGKAGNLRIGADSLLLDRGSITAETGKSGNEEDSANINLQIADQIVLRNESLISATANEDANGGNINIETGFLIAEPPSDDDRGSDISANAERGNGGRVNITAKAIFGIDFRQLVNPQANRTNDITASSQFGQQGVVNINRLDTDPNQGLVELPETTVNLDPLQACQADIKRASSFVDTRRSGIPSNPNEISSNTVWEDTRSPSPSPSVQSSSLPDSSSAKQIVEAQGWIVEPNGKVILTTQASTVTPDNSRQTPSTCYMK